jgi:hypothetical protein
MNNLTRKLKLNTGTLCLFGNIFTLIGYVIALAIGYVITLAIGYVITLANVEGNRKSLDCVLFVRAYSRARARVYTEYSR